VKVEWTEPAISMVEEIADYIARDNSDAADRVAQRVRDAVNGLTTFPERARPGRYLPGTRDLVISPYIAIFRIHGQVIEVLAVVDGRRGNIAEIVRGV